MLHYANSEMVKGLVDNILLNAYARLDLSEMASMQTLSFRLGWLQAMQRDRMFRGYFIFPSGYEFDQEVRNWNVGIHNKIFYGDNMMPYYSDTDKGGNVYGPNLYFGDPFYQVREDGVLEAGLYDRLEVYYEPKIGDFLYLRVSALFHFNGMKYSGCQQMVGLRFDLNKLLNK